MTIQIGNQFTENKPMPGRTDRRCVCVWRVTDYYIFFFETAGRCYRSRKLRSEFEKQFTKVEVNIG